jgi:hypothetical protein
VNKTKNASEKLKERKSLRCTDAPATEDDVIKLHEWLRREGGIFCSQNTHFSALGFRAGNSLSTVPLRSSPANSDVMEPAGSPLNGSPISNV